MHRNWTLFSPTVILTLAGCLVSQSVLANTKTYHFVDLGILPDGSYTYGRAVNNSRQVAGYGSANLSTLTPGEIAYLYDGAIHPLGTLGGAYSNALGINNSGLVTGFAATADGSLHAFLYDTSMHDLGTLPGGTSSQGNGINNSGGVAGTADVAGFNPHAFLYDTTMHDLGTLTGGSYTFGNGINDFGAVIGYGDDSGGMTHAFFYDTAMHDLGTLLGGTYSYGYAINNSGVMTGIADDSAGMPRAFRYDTSMQALGTLGGDFSYGYAINNDGAIVGTAYLTGNFDFHAFYDDGTGMYDLNDLLDGSGIGWTLQEARGINDNGDIVGYAVDVNGVTHAYLLTSTPEPGSFALVLGLGVTGTLVYRRRRSRVHNVPGIPIP